MTMACSIMLKRILSPKSPPLTKLANLQKKNTHSSTVSVKEIQIPVQWGHVAGKLWGNENQQPILALHGWQDNAGTWDTLAPILSSGCSVLAIDLPGHGLSSWIPSGFLYHDWDLPYLILYIKEYFKWNKLTILSHSMGSIASMRFANMYPKDMDALITFDNIVIDGADPKYAADMMPIVLKKTIGIEQLQLETEPPSYSYEELKKLWCMSTNKSVDIESMDHLMKRGSRPSKTDPQKFVLTRDSRLKHMLFAQESHNFIKEMASRLACPTLYFKCENSKYGDFPLPLEVREHILKKIDKFEMHFVPGTHHLHLNTPELVAPLIINFLTKYDLFTKAAVEQKKKI